MPGSVCGQLTPDACVVPAGSGKFVIPCARMQMAAFTALCRFCCWIACICVTVSPVPAFGSTDRHWCRALSPWGPLVRSLDLGVVEGSLAVGVGEAGHAVGAHALGEGHRQSVGRARREVVRRGRGPVAGCGQQGDAGHRGGQRARPQPQPARLASSGRTLAASFYMVLQRCPRRRSITPGTAARPSRPTPLMCPFISESFGFADDPSGHQHRRRASGNGAGRV